MTISENPSPRAVIDWFYIHIPRGKLSYMWLTGKMDNMRQSGKRGPDWSEIIISVLLIIIVSYKHMQSTRKGIAQ